MFVLLYFNTGPSSSFYAWLLPPPPCPSRQMPEVFEETRLLLCLKWPQGAACTPVFQGRDPSERGAGEGSEERALIKAGIHRSLVSFFKTTMCKNVYSPLSLSLMSACVKYVCVCVCVRACAVHTQGKH